MGILGLGIGTGMPIVTLAVQNTAAPEDMGAATSGVNFFRSLGGAFGVAVFGTIMSTRLTSTLDERFPGTNLIDNDELLSSPERIRALPVEQFDAVADGVASGVSTVFVVALPLIVLAWVLAIVLEDVPLRGEFDVRASMVEGLEGADAHAQ